MEKNARKKGDIKNDVLYILNNKSIFKWILNTGVVNYNSLARLMQVEINNKFGYSPKINTISTTLRKIYNNSSLAKVINPFSDMKIEIITGLTMISCVYNLETINDYFKYSRALRIMPETDTLWAMVRSDSMGTAIKNNQIKMHGEYLEINITIEKSVNSDDIIQAFMQILVFNYVNISQLVMSTDGFELYISSKYFEKVMKLINEIRNNTMI
ncbi:MAG: hypothetical protein M1462_03730 [Candidatus Thermoplasmatota archaeon]|uniref:hypothetical protein n=1 Tax=Ferroplasma sp. TaxID=2591003 RepID=UPI00261985B1|nr:hypothetical protein [Ferroplasma sp.]MCL4311522.1 hypothetical protein [Candidatus Thermoplasmatota archaeon]